jgi:hypothetical protein
LLTVSTWGERSVGDLHIFIVIAEDVNLVDFSASFLLGSRERNILIPVGVEILSEDIKSSKLVLSRWSTCLVFAIFIGTWSEDFLSCAIPLGALLAVLFVLFCFSNLVE